ncbi:integrase, partial [Escherichia coli]|nr:integrase [Escherichia coli]
TKNIRNIVWYTIFNLESFYSILVRARGEQRHTVL